MAPPRTDVQRDPSLWTQLVGTTDPADADGLWSSWPSLRDQGGDDPGDQFGIIPVHVVSGVFRDNVHAVR